MEEKKSLNSSNLQVVVFFWYLFIFFISQGHLHTRYPTTSIIKGQAVNEWLSQRYHQITQQFCSEVGGRGPFLSLSRAPYFSLSPKILREKETSECQLNPLLDLFPSLALPLYFFFLPSPSFCQDAVVLMSLVNIQGHNEPLVNNPRREQLFLLCESLDIFSTLAWRRWNHLACFEGTPISRRQLFSVAVASSTAKEKMVSPTVLGSADIWEETPPSYGTLLAQRGSLLSYPGQYKEMVRLPESTVGGSNFSKTRGCAH